MNHPEGVTIKAFIITLITLVTVNTISEIIKRQLPAVAPATQQVTASAKVPARVEVPAKAPMKNPARAVASVRKTDKPVRHISDFRLLKFPVRVVHN